MNVFSRIYQIIFYQTLIGFIPSSVNKALYVVYQVIVKTQYSCNQIRYQYYQTQNQYTFQTMLILSTIRKLPLALIFQIALLLFTEVESPLHCKYTWYMYSILKRYTKCLSAFSKTLSTFATYCISNIVKLNIGIDMNGQFYCGVCQSSYKIFQLT